jgi:P pilus assembly chaperone PapD
MKRALLFGAFVAFCGVAQGAVSLAGTRLIFDGRFSEASIEVSNRRDSLTLIQAWLADPRATQASPVDLPFAVTPHLARLPARGKQSLRLLYEGTGMPQDRESMLHLYVLEIPRRSEAAQQMSIAIRQRINVFYRPKGLPGNPADAAQALSWQWPSRGEHGLVVRNPTPFHVSLQNIRVDGVEISEYHLLSPFSSASLALPPTVAKGPSRGSLFFNALTDYGGQRDYCAGFQGNAPFSVPLRTPDSHPHIGKY